ncbi:phytoene desaturase family protein [Streptacidiphilus monticola]|uniref:Phytoene desaturase family protein n=1 Tax=Streptacidiphilus monticola TaxID=2161674 RepID=A0ABW1FVF6_9ACTN
MARIVVIGAGMGGLAAAARLATLGHAVTLCEAGPAHGGMVGQYERDGFRFDTGPTLLTLPAVYRDLMLKTGRTRLEDEVELRPVDPGSEHVLPDGTRFALANASRAKVLAELDAKLGTGAGERWGELLERGRGVWEATRRPLLEEPLPEDTAPLHRDPYAPAKRGLFARPPRTLADVARKELRHDGLAALLDEYALRFGLNPETAPASLTVLPYMEQSFGVWYVTGGMRALADAVLRRCRARGVELRFDSPVARVLGEERVTGVLLADGTTLDADVVVADVDPAMLTRLGVPEDDGTSPEPSTRSRFVVLLALRGARPEGTPHRTVVHTTDRREELDALAGGYLPTAPTLEVLRPDDASLHPARHETVSLCAGVPGHGPDAGQLDWQADGQRAAAFAEHLITLAERAAPGLRERVLWYEIRTPADLAREHHAAWGAVPGPALAGGGGAHLARRNTTSLPGLYRVGQHAHPGGGLARVGMSASVTAGLIGPA